MQIYYPRHIPIGAWYNSIEKEALRIQISNKKDTKGNVETDMGKLDQT